MSSKWRPWDFCKHHPQVIDSSTKELTAVFCTDPFVERILRNKLDFESWDGESCLILSGMELTVDWIQENLQSLSLFGGNQAVTILQAQQMSSSVKNYLLENNIVDGNRHVLFFFAGDKKFFNQWQKKSEGQFLEVEEPKFWEFGKLLTYFSDEMGIRLPMDVHNYLLEAVPHESAEFVNTLKTIRLSLGPGPHKLKDIIEIVPAKRLDTFKFATLLGKKDFQGFYKELEKLDLDFDEQVGFYHFLQTHLFKILDPSYIDKKKRATKYDKEVHSHSHLWKKDEAVAMIRHFSKFEIEAKKKSPYIKEMIRTSLIAEL